MWIVSEKWWKPGQDSCINNSNCEGKSDDWPVIHHAPKAGLGFQVRTLNT